MKHSLFKRIFAIVLAGALVLALASCSNGQPSAQNSGNSTGTSNSDTIELTFWYSFGGANQVANETLTQQFNDTIGKEKGIHVTAEYQGSYNETTAKLQAAAVAGTMPDVSVVGTTSMGIFLENGQLTPLNTYVERDLDTSDFFEGLLKNTVKDGTWYGVPYLCSTPILYVNATLLEKAGLDPHRA